MKVVYTDISISELPSSNNRHDSIGSLLGSGVCSGIVGVSRVTTRGRDRRSGEGALAKQSTYCDSRSWEIGCEERAGAIRGVYAGVLIPPLRRESRTNLWKAMSDR